MDLFEIIWLLFVLYALLSGVGRSLRGDGPTTRRPRLPRPQDWGWPFDVLGEEEDAEEPAQPARPVGPARPARPAPAGGRPPRRVRPARPARPAPAAGRPPRPGGLAGRGPSPAAASPAGAPAEGVGGGEGASSLEGLPAEALSAEGLPAEGLPAPVMAAEGPEPDARGLQLSPSPPPGRAVAAGGVDRRRLADAVAWAVILGPPRAQRPWRPLGWRGEGG